jgi:sugar lactone lactonase YvrE
MYEPRDQALGVLYALLGHDAQAMAHGATTANGLAWSPDARTLYWADTAAHRVRAWDFDAASGAMTHERVFHQFASKPAGWIWGVPGQAAYGGRPDGAAVDAEGAYWSAQYEGQRLVRLSPRGEVLAEIDTPVPCPTMPCFGGPDLRTLFITTSRQGRSDAELARYPLAGCIFSTRVDVPGLPVNFYRLSA